MSKHNELKVIYAYTSDEIESICNRAEGDEYYLKSEADEYICKLKEENAKLVKQIDELESKIPHWVATSKRLPHTFGPHLVIFQNGKGGCIPFNVAENSFQVAGIVLWWADTKGFFKNPEDA